MAKPYKYKGILATPIGSNHRLVAALLADNDPAAWDKARQTEVRKITERIEALCDDFGIPRNSADLWLRLALALADRHVKGFSRAEPKRRGPKGSMLRHADMVRLVDERLDDQKKRNLSAAVRAVAKQLRLNEKETATAERDYRRVKQSEKALGEEWEKTLREAVEKSRQK